MAKSFVKRLKDLRIFKGKLPRTLDPESVKLVILVDWNKDNIDKDDFKVNGSLIWELFPLIITTSNAELIWKFNETFNGVSLCQELPMENLNLSFNYSFQLEDSSESPVLLGNKRLSE